MNVPTWLWIGTIALLVGLLAFDVFIIGRRPHEPSMRECAIAITFYIGLAILFGIGVLVLAGGEYAGEFYAGWLTEYSLSIDNLFVFVIIMAAFKVPVMHQHRVLLVGIVIALVMRGGFIAVGAAARASASALVKPLISTLKSAPAMNAGLAEVTIAPLTGRPS